MQSFGCPIQLGKDLVSCFLRAFANRGFEVQRVKSLLICSCMNLTFTSFHLDVFFSLVLFQNRKGRYRLQFFKVHSLSMDA